MAPENQEHKGHRIELRMPEDDELRARGDEGEAKPELLIDDQPVRYGQLPDGQYYLEEYAYDWQDDLMGLARRFVDYRAKSDEVRREREQGSVE
jgi:hypothetical protein